jgi:hypothetical protein
MSFGRTGFHEKTQLAKFVKDLKIMRSVPQCQALGLLKKLKPTHSFRE